MISIVCPVYNTAKYLDEAIRSVIAQSFADWELLLIDDGSTDGSAEICKSYVALDNRIHYYRKENGGQASARNLGIHHARFEWIAFLDSDDFWVPEKLDVQRQELLAQKPDFLYSAGYEDEQGKLTAYEWHFSRFSGDAFFKILYRSCAVNCNTVLVRKALLLDCGLFDESQELRGVEDWDLWLRITRKSKVIYGSEKKLAHYRIHGGGIHHQMARMFIGKLQVYLKYQHDPQIPRLVKLRQLRYTYRELINFLCEEKRYDEAKTYLRDFIKQDKFNPASWKQALFLKVLPFKAVMWWSNKVIYRVAYRMEYLTYLLFVSRDYRI